MEDYVQQNGSVQVGILKKIVLKIKIKLNKDKISLQIILKQMSII